MVRLRAGEGRAGVHHGPDDGRSEGTTGFIAPELLFEDNSRVTTETDIYALSGLILQVCTYAQHTGFPPAHLSSVKPNWFSAT